MTRRKAAIAVVLIAFAVVSVRTDDPVSSNVRYTGEVVRIFDRKCSPCHGADTVAMPLSNYRQVREWGRAIREEIVEQRMPPWSAARGFAPIQNDLALSAREVTTILSWLDGGMPRGDDRDLPRPPATTRDAATPPDLRLTIPPQRVPALDEHIVRRVVVEWSVERERTIDRVVVHPGRRSVLRGALVFAGDPDDGGTWIGAWSPWQTHVEAPGGRAIRVPARAQFTVELHYRGAEQDTVDSPTIDVFFGADRVRKADSTDADGDIVVPAGAPIRLAHAATVWAILPAADASTSLELTARWPGGAIETLVWMPTYRREWPQPLALRDPIALPAGTMLTLTTDPGSGRATARLSLLSGRAASRAIR